MNTNPPAKLVGSASIAFQTPVYITGYASVVGKKEGEGPLGKKFNIVCEDPMFGCDTWEAAESTMQKEAATLALEKPGLPQPIFVWLLQAISLPKPQHPPLVLPNSKSHFTDFSEPVLL